MTDEIIAIRRKLRDFMTRQTDREVRYYCSIVDSDLTKAAADHSDGAFRRQLMRTVFALAVARRRAELTAAAAAAA